MSNNCYGSPVKKTQRDNCEKITAGGNLSEKLIKMDKDKNCSEKRL